MHAYHQTPHRGRNYAFAGVATLLGLALVLTYVPHHIRFALSFVSCAALGWTAVSALARVLSGHNHTSTRWLYAIHAFTWAWIVLAPILLAYGLGKWHWTGYLLAASVAAAAAHGYTLHIVRLSNMWLAKVPHVLSVREHEHMVDAGWYEYRRGAPSH